MIKFDINLIKAREIFQKKYKQDKFKIKEDVTKILLFFGYLRTGKK